MTLNAINVKRNMSIMLNLKSVINVNINMILLQKNVLVAIQLVKNVQDQTIINALNALMDLIWLIIHVLIGVR